VPAASVIVPVYNRQDSIARAIDSVLAQDFADFELIIIDDASSDSTVRVVESYHDPRVVLLRQPENRGGGAARNLGIRAARGPLIAFLDSDDAFLPHKLGFVTDYFTRHPDVDVLLDSFEIVYPPGKRKGKVRRINPPMTDSREIAAGIYARRVSKAIPALSARHAALLAVGLFDETLKRRQDFDLVVRLTRLCRCATTDQVLWTKFWTAATITGQSHTFTNAILEMCRRNPEYMTTSTHRVGVARDLAHHVSRLASSAPATLRE
jgi:glycosyltransferase involved in cell wall biosynthesis